MEEGAVVPWWQGVLSYLHPTFMWYWLTGPQSWIFRIYRNIKSGFDPRFRRRRRLLSWMGQTAGRDVPDLASVWRDGTILCDILHRTCTSACVGYEESQAKDTFRHAQALAYRCLLLQPAFTEIELSRADLTPNIEKRLFRYLQSLRLAISKKQLNRSVEEESDAEAHIAEEYIARGMGLIMASRNQRAILYIYSRDGSSLMDIHIEIRGPGEDFGSILVTQSESYDNPEGSSIPIEYRLTEEYLRVSYQPRSVGHHELSISRHGYNVPGSPFLVSVDEISEKVPKKRFNSIEWFTEDEEIRQRELKEKKKKAKVKYRVVDFVTEKMYLTEEGKLLKVPPEDARRAKTPPPPNFPPPVPPLTPDIPLIIPPSPASSDESKMMCRKSRTLSPRPRKKRSERAKWTNIKPDRMKYILVKPQKAELKRVSDASAQVTLEFQPSVFQERCKRIVTVCDYLLKHCPRQTSLEIISGAGHILQSLQGEINENTKSDMETKVISEPDKLCDIDDGEDGNDDDDDNDDDEVFTPVTTPSSTVRTIKYTERCRSVSLSHVNDGLNDISLRKEGNDRYNFADGERRRESDSAITMHLASEARKSFRTEGNTKSASRRTSFSSISQVHSFRSQSKSTVEEDSYDLLNINKNSCICNEMEPEHVNTDENIRLVSYNQYSDEKHSIDFQCNDTPTDNTYPEFSQNVISGTDECTNTSHYEINTLTSDSSDAKNISDSLNYTSDTEENHLNRLNNRLSPSKGNHVGKIIARFETNASTELDKGSLQPMSPEKSKSNSENAKNSTTDLISSFISSSPVSSKATEKDNENLVSDEKLQIEYLKSIGAPLSTIKEKIKIFEKGINKETVRRDIALRTKMDVNNDNSISGLSSPGNESAPTVNKTEHVFRAEPAMVVSKHYAELHEMTINTGIVSEGIIFDFQLQPSISKNHATKVMKNQIFRHETSPECQYKLDTWDPGIAKEKARESDESTPKSSESSVNNVYDLSETTKEKPIEISFPSVSKDEVILQKDSDNETHELTKLVNVNVGLTELTNDTCVPITKLLNTTEQVYFDGKCSYSTAVQSEVEKEDGKCTIVNKVDVDNINVGTIDREQTINVNDLHVLGTSPDTQQATEKVTLADNHNTISMIDEENQITVKEMFDCPSININIPLGITGQSEAEEIVSDDNCLNIETDDISTEDKNIDHNATKELRLDQDLVTYVQNEVKQTKQDVFQEESLNVSIPLLQTAEILTGIIVSDNNIVNLPTLSRLTEKTSEADVCSQPTINDSVKELTADVTEPPALAPKLGTSETSTPCNLDENTEIVAADCSTPNELGIENVFSNIDVEKKPVNDTESLIISDSIPTCGILPFKEIGAEEQPLISTRQLDLLSEFNTNVTFVEDETSEITKNVTAVKYEIDKFGTEDKSKENNNGKGLNTYEAFVLPEEVHADNSTLKDTTDAQVKLLNDKPLELSVNDEKKEACSQNINETLFLAYKAEDESVSADLKTKELSTEKAQADIDADITKNATDLFEPFVLKSTGNNTESTMKEVDNELRDILEPPVLPNEHNSGNTIMNVKTQHFSNDNDKQFSFNSNSLENEFTLKSHHEEHTLDKPTLLLETIQTETNEEDNNGQSTHIIKLCVIESENKTRAPITNYNLKEQSISVNEPEALPLTLNADQPISEGDTEEPKTHTQYTAAEVDKIQPTLTEFKVSEQLTDIHKLSGLSAMNIRDSLDGKTVFSEKSTHAQELSLERDVEDHRVRMFDSSAKIAEDTKCKENASIIPKQTTVITELHILSDEIQEDNLLRSNSSENNISPISELDVSVSEMKVQNQNRAEGNSEGQSTDVNELAKAIGDSASPIWGDCKVYEQLGEIPKSLGLPKGHDLQETVLDIQIKEPLLKDKNQVTVNNNTACHSTEKTDSVEHSVHMFEQLLEVSEIENEKNNPESYAEHTTHESEILVDGDSQDISPISRDNIDLKLTNDIESEIQIKLLNKIQTIDDVKDDEQARGLIKPVLLNTEIFTNQETGVITSNKVTCVIDQSPESMVGVLDPPITNAMESDKSSSDTLFTIKNGSTESPISDQRNITNDNTVVNEMDSNQSKHLEFTKESCALNDTVRHEHAESCISDNLEKYTANQIKENVDLQLRPLTPSLPISGLTQRLVEVFENMYGETTTKKSHLTVGDRPGHVSLYNTESSSSSNNNKTNVLSYVTDSVTTFSKNYQSSPAEKPDTQAEVTGLTKRLVKLFDNVYEPLKSNKKIPESEMHTKNIQSQTNINMNKNIPVTKNSPHLKIYHEDTNTTVSNNELSPFSGLTKKLIEVFDSISDKEGERLGMFEPVNQSRNYSDGCGKIKSTAETEGKQELNTEHGSKLMVNVTKTENQNEYNSVPSDCNVNKKEHSENAIRENLREESHFTHHAKKVTATLEHDVTTISTIDVGDDKNLQESHDIHTYIVCENNGGRLTSQQSEIVGSDKIDIYKDQCEEESHISEQHCVSDKITAALIDIEESGNSLMEHIQHDSEGTSVTVSHCTQIDVNVLIPNNARNICDTVLKTNYIETEEFRKNEDCEDIKNKNGQESHSAVIDTEVKNCVKYSEKNEETLILVPSQMEKSSNIASYVEEGELQPEGYELLCTTNTMTAADVANDESGRGSRGVVEFESKDGDLLHYAQIDLNESVPDGDENVGEIITNPEYVENSGMSNIQDIDVKKRKDSQEFHDVVVDNKLEEKDTVIFSESNVQGLTSVPSQKVELNKIDIYREKCEGETQVSELHPVGDKITEPLIGIERCNSSCIDTIEHEPEESAAKGLHFTQINVNDPIMGNEELENVSSVNIAFKSENSTTNVIRCTQIDLNESMTENDRYIGETVTKSICIENGGMKNILDVEVSEITNIQEFNDIVTRNKSENENTVIFSQTTVEEFTSDLPQTVELNEIDIYVDKCEGETQVSELQAVSEKVTAALIDIEESQSPSMVPINPESEETAVKVLHFTQMHVNDPMLENENESKGLSRGNTEFESGDSAVDVLRCNEICLNETMQDNDQSIGESCRKSTYIENSGMNTIQDVDVGTDVHFQKFNDVVAEIESEEENTTVSSKTNEKEISLDPSEIVGVNEIVIHVDKNEEDSQVSESHSVNDSMKVVLIDIGDSGNSSIEPIEHQSEERAVKIIHFTRIDVKEPSPDNEELANAPIGNSGFEAKDGTLDVLRCNEIDLNETMQDNDQNIGESTKMSNNKEKSEMRNTQDIDTGKHFQEPHDVLADNESEENNTVVFSENNLEGLTLDSSEIVGPKAIIIHVDKCEEDSKVLELDSVSDTMTATTTESLFMEQIKRKSEETTVEVLHYTQTDVNLPISDNDNISVSDIKSTNINSCEIKNNNFDVDKDEGSFQFIDVGINIESENKKPAIVYNANEDGLVSEPSQTAESNKMDIFVQEYEESRSFKSHSESEKPTITIVVGENSGSAPKEPIESKRGNSEIDILQCAHIDLIEPIQDNYLNSGEIVISSCHSENSEVNEIKEIDDDKNTNVQTFHVVVPDIESNKKNTVIFTETKVEELTSDPCHLMGSNKIDIYVEKCEERTQGSEQHSVIDKITPFVDTEESGNTSMKQVQQESEDTPVNVSHFTLIDGNLPISDNHHNIRDTVSKSNHIENNEMEKMVDFNDGMNESVEEPHSAVTGIEVKGENGVQNSEMNEETLISESSQLEPLDNIGSCVDESTLQSCSHELPCISNLITAAEANEESDSGSRGIIEFESKDGNINLLNYTQILTQPDDDKNVDQSVTQSAPVENSIQDINVSKGINVRECNDVVTDNESEQENKVTIFETNSEGLTPDPAQTVGSDKIVGKCEEGLQVSELNSVSNNITATLIDIEESGCSSTEAIEHESEESAVKVHLTQIDVNETISNDDNDSSEKVIKSRNINSCEIKNNSHFDISKDENRLIYHDVEISIVSEKEETATLSDTTENALVNEPSIRDQSNNMDVFLEKYGEESRLFESHSGSDKTTVGIIVDEESGSTSQEPIESGSGKSEMDILKYIHNDPNEPIPDNDNSSGDCIIRSRLENDGENTNVQKTSGIASDIISKEINNVMSSKPNVEGLASHPSQMLRLNKIDIYVEKCEGETQLSELHSVSGKITAPLTDVEECKSSSMEPIERKPAESAVKGLHFTQINVNELIMDNEEFENGSIGNVTFEPEDSKTDVISSTLIELNISMTENDQNVDESVTKSTCIENGGLKNIQVVEVSNSTKVQEFNDVVTNNESEEKNNVIFSETTVEGLASDPPQIVGLNTIHTSVDKCERETRVSELHSVCEKITDAFIDIEELGSPSTEPINYETEETTVNVLQLNQIDVNDQILENEESNFVLRGKTEIEPEDCTLHVLRCTQFDLNESMQYNDQNIGESVKQSTCTVKSGIYNTQDIDVSTGKNVQGPHDVVAENESGETNTIVYPEANVEGLTLDSSEIVEPNDIVIHVDQYEEDSPVSELHSVSDTMTATLTGSSSMEQIKSECKENEAEVLHYTQTDVDVAIPCNDNNISESDIKSKEINSREITNNKFDVAKGGHFPQSQDVAVDFESEKNETVIISNTNEDALVSEHSQIVESNKVNITVQEYKESRSFESHSESEKTAVTIVVEESSKTNEKGITLDPSEIVGPNEIFIHIDTCEEGSQGSELHSVGDTMKAAFIDIKESEKSSREPIECQSEENAVKIAHFTQMNVKTSTPDNEESESGAMGNSGFDSEDSTLNALRCNEIDQHETMQDNDQNIHKQSTYNEKIEMRITQDIDVSTGKHVQKLHKVDAANESEENNTVISPANNLEGLILDSSKIVRPNEIVIPVGKCQQYPKVSELHSVCDTMAATLTGSSTIEQIKRESEETAVEVLHYTKTDIYVATPVNDNNISESDIESTNINGCEIKNNNFDVDKDEHFLQSQDVGIDIESDNKKPIIILNTNEGALVSEPSQTVESNNMDISIQEYEESRSFESHSESEKTTIAIIFDEESGSAPKEPIESKCGNSEIDILQCTHTDLIEPIQDNYLNSGEIVISSCHSENEIKEIDDDKNTNVQTFHVVVPDIESNEKNTVIFTETNVEGLTSDPSHLMGSNKIDIYVEKCEEGTQDSEQHFVIEKITPFVDTEESGNTSMKQIQQESEETPVKVSHFTLINGNLPISDNHHNISDTVSKSNHIENNEREEIEDFNDGINENVEKPHSVVTDIEVKEKILVQNSERNEETLISGPYQMEESNNIGSCVDEFPLKSGGYESLRTSNTMTTPDVGNDESESRTRGIIEFESKDGNVDLLHYIQIDLNESVPDDDKTVGESVTQFAHIENSGMGNIQDILISKVTNGQECNDIVTDNESDEKNKLIISKTNVEGLTLDPSQTWSNKVNFYEEDFEEGLQVSESQSVNNDATAALIDIEVSEKSSMGPIERQSNDSSDKVLHSTLVDINIPDNDNISESGIMSKNINSCETKNNKDFDVGKEQDLPQSHDVGVCIESEEKNTVKISNEDVLVSEPSEIEKSNSADISVQEYGEESRLIESHYVSEKTTLVILVDEESGSASQGPFESESEKREIEILQCTQIDINEPIQDNDHSSSEAFTNSCQIENTETSKLIDINEVKNMNIQESSDVTPDIESKEKISIISPRINEESLLPESSQIVMSNSNNIYITKFEESLQVKHCLAEFGNESHQEITLNAEEKLTPSEVFSSEGTHYESNENIELNERKGGVHVPAASSQQEIMPCIFNVTKQNKVSKEDSERKSYPSIVTPGDEKPEDYVNIDILTSFPQDKDVTELVPELLHSVESQVPYEDPEQIVGINNSKMVSCDSGNRHTFPARELYLQLISNISAPIENTPTLKGGHTSLCSNSHDSSDGGNFELQNIVDESNAVIKTMTENFKTTRYDIERVNSTSTSTYETNKQTNNSFTQKSSIAQKIKQFIFPESDEYNIHSEIISQSEEQFEDHTKLTYYKTIDNNNDQSDLASSSPEPVILSSALLNKRIESVKTGSSVIQKLKEKFEKSSINLETCEGANEYEQRPNIMNIKPLEQYDSLPQETAKLTSNDDTSKSDYTLCEGNYLEILNPSEELTNLDSPLNFLENDKETSALFLQEKDSSTHSTDIKDIWDNTHDVLLNTLKSSDDINHCTNPLFTNQYTITLKENNYNKCQNEPSSRSNTPQTEGMKQMLSLESETLNKNLLTVEQELSEVLSIEDEEFDRNIEKEIADIEEMETPDIKEDEMFLLKGNDEPRNRGDELTYKTEDVQSIEDEKLDLKIQQQILEIDELPSPDDVVMSFKHNNNNCNSDKKRLIHIDPSLLGFDSIYGEVSNLEEENLDEKILKEINNVDLISINEDNETASKTSNEVNFLRPRLLTVDLELGDAVSIEDEEIDEETQKVLLQVDEAYSNPTEDDTSGGSVEISHSAMGFFSDNTSLDHSISPYPELSKNDMNLSVPGNRKIIQVRYEDISSFDDNDEAILEDEKEGNEYGAGEYMVPNLDSLEQNTILQHDMNNYEFFSSAAPNNEIDVREVTNGLSYFEDVVSSPAEPEFDSLQSETTGAGESYSDSLPDFKDLNLSLSTESDSSEFHMWSSNVEFGEPAEAASVPEGMDFDSIISAPNLDEALKKLERHIQDKGESFQWLSPRTPSPSLQSLEKYFKDGVSCFDTDEFYNQVSGGAIVEDVTDRKDDISDIDENDEKTVWATPCDTLPSCTYAPGSIEAESVEAENHEEQSQEWIISPYQYPRVILGNTTQMSIIDEEDDSRRSEPTSPLQKKIIDIKFCGNKNLLPVKSEIGSVIDRGFSKDVTSSINNTSNQFDHQTIISSPNKDVTGHLDKGKSKNEGVPLPLGQSYSTKCEPDNILDNTNNTELQMHESSNDNSCNSQIGTVTSNSARQCDAKYEVLKETETREDGQLKDIVTKELSSIENKPSSNVVTTENAGECNVLLEHNSNILNEESIVNEIVTSYEKSSQKINSTRISLDSKDVTVLETYHESGIRNVCEEHATKDKKIRDEIKNLLEDNIDSITEEIINEFSVSERKLYWDTKLKRLNDLENQNTLSSDLKRLTKIKSGTVSKLVSCFAQTTESLPGSPVIQKQTFTYPKPLISQDKLDKQVETEHGYKPVTKEIIKHPTYELPERTQCVETDTTVSETASMKLVSHWKTYWDDMINEQKDSNKTQSRTVHKIPSIQISEDDESGGSTILYDEVIHAQNCSIDNVGEEDTSTDIMDRMKKVKCSVTEVDQKELRFTNVKTFSNIRDKNQTSGNLKNKPDNSLGSNYSDPRLEKKFMGKNQREETGVDLVSSDISLLPPMSRPRSYSAGNIDKGFLTIPNNTCMEISKNHEDGNPQNSENTENIQQQNEFKTRFERAKQFFKHLEASGPGDIKGRDYRSMPRLDLASHKKRKPSVDSDSGPDVKPQNKRDHYKNRRRKKKKDKTSYAIRSAPTSDTETSKRVPRQESYDSFGGSVKIGKVSERFHVKDLFRDVSDKDGFFKGIPNRAAVLASLRSVDDVRALSPYEMDYADLKSSASLGNIPSGFQEEYPYLPTTPIHSFRPRSSLGLNLIPRSELLDEKF